MPSTTSSCVSRPFASSTVMTPSLPTLPIASAMISPMVESLFAEIVPTCAISFCSLVGLDIDLSSPTTTPTALSMPRLSVIGSWPAATSLSPSVKMARARTVAVVVPSPATSEVLEATSFTIWAPMFSNLSASSISFATVTPSLVTAGAPHDFSRTTFRPRGPSVTVTASARMLMPRRTLARASSPNRTIFAAMAPSPPLGLDDAEDVLLAEDQVLLAVELDLGAGVLAEQHSVAGLHVEGQHLPVLLLARADGHHLPLLRLLLGRIGDDDAARALLLLLLDAPDDHPVLQRANPHRHENMTSSRAGSTAGPPRVPWFGCHSTGAAGPCRPPPGAKIKSRGPQSTPPGAPRVPFTARGLVLTQGPENPNERRDDGICW